jgi:DMSO/TMAO reductase YedYZ molybdopterin-dependent catalytic subunit
LRYDTTPAGLHYVLVHYDIPAVEPDGWRLRLRAPGRSVELTLAELTAMPAHTERVTMECAGNGRALLEPRPVSQPWLTGAVGTADWTGVRLVDLLDRCDVDTTRGVDVVFRGADHGTERGVEQDYARGLPLAEALRPEVLVAWAMNGAPLPVQHGFPARLVVPGWYGMASVKWLTDITVETQPFDGFQNRAYRLRQEADEEGEPVTWIRPRALLAPPGHPDFMTRDRVLAPGPVELFGRAWSGHAPVRAVEVSTDGGGSWTAATLGPATSRYSWRSFSLAWQAEPGEHLLLARASDERGDTQPGEPAWNRGGFANNVTDAVRVRVTDG